MNGFIKRLFALFLVIAMVTAVFRTDIQSIADGVDDAPEENVKVWVDPSRAVNVDHVEYSRTTDADGETSLKDTIIAALGEDNVFFGEAMGQEMILTVGTITAYYGEESDELIEAILAEREERIAELSEILAAYEGMMGGGVDPMIDPMIGPMGLDDDLYPDEPVATPDENGTPEDEGGTDTTPAADGDGTDETPEPDNDEAPANEMNGNVGDLADPEDPDDLDGGFGVDPDMGLDSEEYAALYDEWYALQNIFTTMWVVFVNGEPYYDGLEDLVINPGDVIEIKYSTMGGNDLVSTRYGVMLLDSTIAGIIDAYNTTPKPGDDYKPTQIRNGAFDVHPYMYIPKGDGSAYTMEEILNEAVKQGYWTAEQKKAWETAVFSWSGDRDNNPALFIKKGTGNTYDQVIIHKYNGTDDKDITPLLTSLDRTDSWRTTETAYQYEASKIKDYFEWINGYPSSNIPLGPKVGGKSTLQSTYGMNIYFANDNDASLVDPCVELNKQNAATLYQDLKTTGKDIILWSLMHAGRDEGAPADQNMRVVMGPYTSDAVAGTEEGATNITDTSRTVFSYSGSANVITNGSSLTGGKVGGFANEGDLDGLLVHKNYNWKKASGIYIVPGTGTGMTRFAFQSTNTNSLGNFLDDVVFDTLAGNLQTTIDGDTIIVTGYWGDLDDAGDELIYEIFGDDPTNPIGTVILNMKNVDKGPFKAEITKTDMINAGVDTGKVNQAFTSGNPDKNDIIPKDYYGAITTQGQYKYATVKFDTQVSSVKNPDSQIGFQITDPSNYGQASVPSEPGDLKENDIIVDGLVIKEMKGWFTDKTTGSKYDFSTDVTQDKTLYAQYNSVSKGLIFSGNKPSDASGSVSNIPALQHSGTGGVLTGSEQNGVDPGSDPYLSGYKFEGWYTTPNPGESDLPYDFAHAANINDNETRILYAKWSKVVGAPPTGGGGGGGSSTPSKPVTLGFDMNGMSTVSKPGNQTGSTGFLGNYPTSIFPGQIVTGPDGKQYEFTGWYTDGSSSTYFDFSDPINKDKTAFAGWKPVASPAPGGADSQIKVDPNDPNKITVDFITEIGVTPDTQIKLPGLTAEDPHAPMDPATLQPGTIIGDMMFIGWYIDEARTIPYDFNRVLSDSITLFAKWERVEGDAIDPPKQEGVLSPKTGYIFSLSTTQLYTLIALLVLMASALTAVFFTRARRR